MLLGACQKVLCERSLSYDEARVKYVLAHISMHYDVERMGDYQNIDTTQRIKLQKSLSILSIALNVPLSGIYASKPNYFRKVR